MYLVWRGNGVLKNGLQGGLEPPEPISKITDIWGDWVNVSEPVQGKRQVVFNTTARGHKLNGLQRPQLMACSQMLAVYIQSTL